MESREVPLAAVHEKINEIHYLVLHAAAVKCGEYFIEIMVSKAIPTLSLTSV